MDKESVFELQKIDCNCNDCIYMQRDFETFKKWEDWRKESQLKEFDLKKEAALKIANSCDNESGKKSLLFIANKMRFLFDRSGLITYGLCKIKNNKPISFIPNICQIDTQQCFKHRKIDN